MDRNWKQALWVSWLFVGALVLLSVSLAVLQYRWIGEVSKAERERLRSTLQTSLNRLSQDFNSELRAAFEALIPERADLTGSERESEYAARYAQWRDLAHHHRMFKSISRATPHGGTVALRTLVAGQSEFRDAAWPPGWEDLRGELAARSSAARGALPRLMRRIAEEHPDLIELPIFASNARPSLEAPFFREREWLIVQLDLDYLRSEVLPELIRRHLGSGGTVEYAARITPRDDLTRVIYDDGWAGSAQTKPDATVRMFDVRLDQAFRRMGLFPLGPSTPERAAEARIRLAGDPPQTAPIERGRWVLSVRHREGSLEAFVEKTRWRNLAVTTGIMVLMIGAVGAVVQYTRRAQTLADLQMEFVAGVSHELRTPLSVMRTAGHNLQGKVSADPARVQRYGTLIAEESDKLTQIVDQILRFSNVRAGRAITSAEPVEVEALMEDVMRATRRVTEASQCVVDKSVEPALPPVIGDSTALKHALQNLITNAAKYGREGNWIGLTAKSVRDGDAPVVEIRVADHGPGIPRDELAQIFEPFYRGRRAIADQVHGTGLGLSLAKRIIEAHRGTIRVRTEEGKGAEFIIRIPAAPLSHTV